MSNRKVEVMRHGCWSSAYLSGHLWIIRQNWDYYHEDFYDEGPPSLDEEGWAYYALYGYMATVDAHITRSRTCLSELEAIEMAGSAFEAVLWD